MNTNWPQSLKAAVAVDDLARMLYACRCAYYEVPEQVWGRQRGDYDQARGTNGVPFHLRSGFHELALRLLKQLGEAPPGGTDALFRLATELARAENRHVRGTRLDYVELANNLTQCIQHDVNGGHLLSTDVRKVLDAHGVSDATALSHTHAS